MDQKSREYNKLTNQMEECNNNDVDPFTTSIKLEQTILDYGRDLELEKKYNRIRFSKSKLIKKEQDVLHSAIDAYSNLILAEKNIILMKRI